MKTNIKQLGLLFFIVSCFSKSHGQEQKVFANHAIKAAYGVFQGSLNGKYESYYPNGQKKATGFFENNYRTGQWTLWDSIGNKRMDRVYSSPFIFEQLTPAVSTSGPIPILSKPVYEPTYNPQGYLDYYPLEERMIMWSKRMWRTIEKQDNPILFQDDFLSSTMLELVNNYTVTAYSGKDDEFTKPFDRSLLETKEMELIHYKIKEDWVFDNERLVMECRIIGICPTVKTGQDTLDLCWFYYPEIRQFFAKKTLDSKLSPEHINTLDDLFFYRYFSGTIYKEANVYDRAIADYKNKGEIEKEAERIEIDIIESEHDIWMSLTTKK